MRNQFELMTDSLLEDGDGVNCGVEQGARFEDEDEQVIQDLLEHDGSASFLEDCFDGVDDDSLVVLVWHGLRHN